MEKEKYITRLAEKTLERKLHTCGCVVVSGPKFCGKSTMCKRFAKSLVALNTTNSIGLANSDPISILKGDYPRLIDEWQKAPDLWNYIKADLDDDYIFGKYILTGSTTPVNPKLIQHNGAGRMAPMILKPLSLYESKESSGIVSLSNLFTDKVDFKSLTSNENKANLHDIATYICRGGWPMSLKAGSKYSLDTTLSYYEGLFTESNESDEFSEFLKNKNIELLKIILKSYARNISTQAKNTSMIKDILESGVRSSLTDDTFLSYTKTLKDLFIIYDMPAWNLNLRTTISVRTAPTHHFIDTSIAAACLGIKPDDLLNDLRSFGLFFEDFVVRDLSIYAESLNAKLKHYRDSSNQEVDAIVELPNSTYAAIEIKIYSEKNIDEAIKSLHSFEEKIKRSKLKLPKFKMIITSHGPCYKKDDIFIVPINCLRD